jgi:peptidoglycan/xylan/chitin deacetylase (PgdA/CDA1 family)
MYHAVTTVPAGPLSDLAVPPRLLAEHLAALSSVGYRLIGLTEALEEFAAGSTEPLVALTFDDGYADFLTAALPALAAAQASATLYPSVGHLGGHANWLGAAATDFGRLLTPGQLAEVAAAGIEIGSHSLIHHPLDVLTTAQLVEEVTQSRDRLEQQLHRTVRSFCYPHGYHGARVRAVVARAGHDNACEVGRRLHRPGDDRFAVPRLQPTPEHRGADLIRLVRHGGSPWVPQAKRLAQPAWRITRKAARRFGRQLT